MRETQDISSGASPSALEHDCGRRTAVIVVSGLLTSLLSWLRYCCEKVERGRAVDSSSVAISANHLLTWYW